MSEKIQLTAVETSRLPDPDHRNVRRFCPKCGREIPPDRGSCMFCENTGALSRPRQSGRKKLMIGCGIFCAFFVLLIISLLMTRPGL